MSQMRRTSPSSVLQVPPEGDTAEETTPNQSGEDPTNDNQAWNSWNPSDHTRHTLYLSAFVSIDLLTFPITVQTDLRNIMMNRTLLVSTSVRRLRKDDI